MSKFGFIGCGNMGGALVSATAKVVSAENIYLCDALKAKSEELANKYTNKQKAKKSNYKGKRSKQLVFLPPRQQLIAKFSPF